MPKIKVIEPFKWSPNGIEVLEYGKGDNDVDEACAELAWAEGWAAPPGGKKAASGKAGGVDKSDADDALKGGESDPPQGD